MTHEIYSKATDIQVGIQHLRDIRDVLVNSKGNELVARKLKKFDTYSSSTGYTEYPSDIMNVVHIMDEPILKKLIQVVDEEIKILEDEFRRL